MVETRKSNKRGADESSPVSSTPKRSPAKATATSNSSPSSVAQLPGGGAKSSPEPSNDAELSPLSAAAKTAGASKPQATADEDALEKLFQFSPTAKSTIMELIAGLSGGDDFLNAYPPKVFFVRYGPFAFKSFLGVDVIEVGLEWREKYAASSNYPSENILVSACDDDDDMMSHKLLNGEKVVFLEKSQTSIATSVHPPSPPKEHGSTIVTVGNASLADVSPPTEPKKQASSILSLRQKCMGFDSGDLKRYVCFVHHSYHDITSVQNENTTHSESLFYCVL